MRTRLASEEIQGRNFNSLLDYIASQQKTEPLDAEFPIEYPGVGKITHRQWQALPDFEKQYAAYVHAMQSQKLAGGYTEPIMSREEFRREVHPNTRLQYLEELMKDPEKMAAEKKLRAAGAPQVNVGATTRERVEATEQVESEQSLQSGKITDKVSEFEDSNTFRAKLSGVPKDRRPEEAARMVKNYIEQMIAARGGIVTDVKVDKKTRTMTWTVKFKQSGKEMEYSHVFK